MTTPLPPADLEERRPLVSIAVVPCMIHIIVKDRIDTRVYLFKSRAFII